MSFEAVHPPAAEPVRILIIDDDPISCAFQSHLVSLLGYSAQSCSDPEQAIAQVQSGAFDAVLLDLGMPQLDGFEVLRRLREHEERTHHPALPVIAVTGYASESDRLRCLMAGFNEHLSKPLQASSLGAVLARVLAPRAARGIADSGAAYLSDAERLRATVKRLGEVRPDDRAFAPTVTESFALRSAQLIENLHRAAKSQDKEQAVRAARALRSAAEFLGALGLAGMSERLEQAADVGDWAGVAEQVTAIEHEHQVVLALLFETSRPPR